MDPLVIFIVINSTSLIVAFIFDLIFGEFPVFLHPVVYLGKFISFLEKILYPLSMKKLFSGVILGIICSSSIFLSTYFIASVLWETNKLLYFIFSTYIYFSSISIKCLKDHALEVKSQLDKKDLYNARKQLSKIVTRDTCSMKEEEIVKSTVESVAENFVDSIFAIIFYAIFGPPMVCLFKSISTLDSMVGYKNRRYLQFGKFSAKLDDIMCFFPARVSIIPVLFGAHVLFNRSKESLKSFLKFRLKHSSPNSAHSISSFVGALNIKVGGVVTYFGEKSFKPVIGYGKNKAKPYKIKECIDLLTTSSLFSLILFILTNLILILGIFLIKGGIYG